MRRGKGRLLAGLLLLGTLGCGGGAGDSYRAPAGTPIVLISVDTLRSDRLPAYGYSEVATPAIDRLRAESILFRHAYAPVPLTFPSHSTAFTGLLPPAHGTRDNMGYRLDTEDLPYMPRRLKESGYATGAAVSTFVLRGSSGLAASFDFYEDSLIFVEKNAGSVQRPGKETLQRARPWLRANADQPFFFFFHIYEPHTPREPPEPYASRYTDPYDGEVAYADEIVGDFLRELESLGVYDQAAIFFMSDHGEGLQEHGYDEHGPLLYREAIQVPLMVKLPGARRGGETVEEVAQLADIYPTVLGMLGLEPSQELDGQSLLGLDAPDAPARQVYSETVFTRLHFGWSDLYSLIEYPYHYIHGPDPELYDLETDPAELTNILRREARLARRLDGLLDDIDRTLEAPTAEDPETLEKLAALGYLGGGSTETEGPLPDPKARLFVLDILREALELETAGDYAGAIEGLRAVLEEEPGMIDAWEKLGTSLVADGRAEEGVEALEEAMRRSDGAPQIALALADVLLQLNRLDEAQVHAEIALSTHELARDVLAQVHIRRDELERAEELAVEANRARGGRLGPLITLAELRYKQGRFEESIALAQEAEDEFGDRTDREKLRGLYFIRARARIQTGDAEGATSDFLTEIELSPDQLAPYTHLAYLYALRDLAAEAGSTLQKMLEVNPTAEAHAEAVRTLRAMGDSNSASALLGFARRQWPGDADLRELERG